MKRAPKTENDVKSLVKDWYNNRRAWHYAPVQQGLGVIGIHDRIGCVPVLVTPEMVGRTIGLFVSVESKRPGRRGEERRGMSVHQSRHMNEINEAGGLSIVCDGQEDLDGLNRLIAELVGGKRE